MSENQVGRTMQPLLCPSNPYYYWYCHDCDIYIGSRPKTDYFNCPYCGGQWEVAKCKHEFTKHWWRAEHCKHCKQEKRVIDDER